MEKAIMAVMFLAAVLTGAAKAEREFSFDKHDSFDGEKVAAVKIDLPSGDIELAKSTSNEIEIDFKNVIFAEDRDEAEDINNDCSYKAEVSGNELTVTIELPRHLRKRGVLNRLLSGDWDEKINPYLRVRIPDGKDVELKSSSADLEASKLNLNLDVWSSSTDVRVRDTEGRLTFDLSSGDVDISHHNGDVKVKGNSSDLDFRAIEGNVDVKTSSGDGSLNGVKGSVLVYASSGDFKLFDIEGDLDARTSSGDIYASGVSGSVRAEASSGDITLKELSSKDGEFDVETSSGDVSLEVADSFGGRISLNSNSGTVYSRLSGDIESVSESRFKGNIGDGNGRLSVSTVSGDIRVNRF